MILRKAMPSIFPVATPPSTHLQSLVPSNPWRKTLCKLSDRAYICCFDDQVTNVSLFFCNYPGSGAQAMDF